MKPPRFFSVTVTSLFGVIVLLPILFMFTSPFWTQDFGHLNHDSLFDSRYLTLTENSLGLAIGTTILCLIIGIPLAFLLYRTNLWGRKIFRIIYIIPVLIPPYIHAVVWCHLNTYIKQFFSLDIHCLWGAILVLSLSYFPFVALMTMSGLKSVDKNMEEASLLCHGKWRTLTKITLPLVTPHVLSGAIFVFIFSIVDFGVPDILRLNVYPVEIFIQFSAFYNERAAAILSLPLIAVALLLIVLQRQYMKGRSYVNISGGSSKTKTYNLGRLNLLAFSFCFIVLGLSVFLPIIILLKVAGPLSNYARILNTSINQIGFSLALAALGAVTALSLAFCLSYLVVRTNIKIKHSIEFASFIPLAIPATTLGIGLIKVWNQPMADFIYTSFLIIIFGYIARFIPFITIATTSGLKQINPHLEEAAFLNTAHWNKVIRNIVLPLLKPSLLAGFFIAFILSFGELGTTLLVIPPGRETIPIKIYNLMHYGADQVIAALSLILIVIILSFSGLFLIFHHKFSKSILCSQ